MCTGLEIAALAASAAGTVASVSSAQEQNKARQRALMQGIEEDSAIQDKANKRTDEYVTENFDPTKRIANYEGEAVKTEKSLGDLLTTQAATGQGDITASTTGAVSDAYTRQKAKTTADTTQRSRTLAKLLSRAGASSGLFNTEALNGADYSSDLLGYGAESQMAKNRTNVNLGAAGGAGGGLALLGGLLSGGSGALAGMGKPKPPSLPVGT